MLKALDNVKPMVEVEADVLVVQRIRCQLRFVQIDVRRWLCVG